MVGLDPAIHAGTLANGRGVSVSGPSVLARLLGMEPPGSGFTIGWRGRGVT